MQAGKLRHYLTLEEPQETTSSHGVVQQTWTTVAQAWCSIEPLAGREGFAASQMYASATSFVKTRYRAGVIPKMRWRKGTRVWEIDDVQNTMERNRELVCIATERNL